MKKYLLILFLLPCFVQAQKNDKILINGCEFSATILKLDKNQLHNKILTDTPHVHYFEKISLPQCDMGDGWQCAVAHFRILPCACGAEPTIGLMFPGIKIITGTTDILTDSTIKEGLKRGDTLRSATPSPMPFPFVHAPYSYTPLDILSQPSPSFSRSTPYMDSLWKHLNE